MNNRKGVTAMAFVWTDDLLTGNSTIDSQHKQLIKAIGDLMEACSGGKAGEQLDSTMKFLIDYTAKHFGDEERLQQQHSYPDYPNHKKLHAYFTATVGDLAKQLKADGPSVTLVVKIQNSLGQWFVNHIKSEDKKVAAHIRGS